MLLHNDHAISQDQHGLSRELIVLVHQFDHQTAPHCLTSRDSSRRGPEQLPTLPSSYVQRRISDINMTEDVAFMPSSAQAASVVQKLAARQAQIAAEREHRQQQLQSEADPREDINNFLSGFAADHSRLLEQCSSLQASASAATDEAARQPLLKQLEDVSTSIAKQEQATASAAYFLPAYELRSCTAQLLELRARVAAIKQQLQPKRKFAFSSKGISRKPAAEATATTAAVAATSLQLQPQQHADVQQADQTVAAAATAAESLAGQTAVPPPSSHDLQLIQSGQGCMGLRNATVVKAAGQLQPGQAFVLHDLQDCTVYLLGRLSALRLQQLQRCHVYAGPVAGATFISGASSCTLMVASHQVRIHDVYSSNIYLRVRSHPIIEHSKGLLFAPFPIERLLQQQQQQQKCEVELQQQQQHQAACSLLRECQLDEENGLWQHVNDFGWVKASQSPNWGVLCEAERQQPPLPPAADCQAGQ